MSRRAALLPAGRQVILFPAVKPRASSLQDDSRHVTVWVGFTNGLVFEPDGRLMAEGECLTSIAKEQCGGVSFAVNEALHMHAPVDTT